ncbi:hypothetical protein BJI67_08635 [Acidihalobacter aeolianus]|uniref:Uncharacterized protein n=1 Tax=Acidihalobacter aeolianus TaxID=2792603 RepID=A0A1D8K817_9GAMM|nr:hypothetical protein BJI67_08635 [Acidihalobacter aeolianus]
MARQRLRSAARAEPWALRLLEPANRPLLLAFATGLAAGGMPLARRWLHRRLLRALPRPR